MAVLSREAIVGLCAQVGLQRGQIPLAGAICDAESGRRTDAVGVNYGDRNNPGSRDRGLWQINDYYHPDISDQCAFNAVCNARAMFAISSGGTNWRPWSTYNNGAYRAYLAAYETLVGGQPYTPPAAPPDAVGSLVTQLRQGYPFWKAVLGAWESQVSLARAAVWDQQNVTTDLGSRLF